MQKNSSFRSQYSLSNSKKIIEQIITEERNQELYLKTINYLNDSHLSLQIEELVYSIPKLDKKNKVMVPRPLNTFIIYRRIFQAKFIQTHGRKTASKVGHISKMASMGWKQEKEDIKNIYAFMASLSIKVHKKVYPYYAYKPRKYKIKPSVGTFCPRNSHNNSLSLNETNLLPLSTLEPTFDIDITKYDKIVLKKLIFN
ncbi:hypothetical protein [endosymbiont GvMRE of Glomus versiforme]|uniref:hypothetical protein n=1 Tax=endosymbiont GvMRE of Glomus versiforme TaxID=2039283 RepID=UPI000EBE14BF|nr:hypothetical protein [endosymbiont GvMRE of Glomus versiforme]RHZ35328.1 MATA-HMG [endosymbiont GvMRE of Glomus versiforme]